MARRKHFTVYWDEEEDGALMEVLEEIARQEKRSRSATVLIALQEYVMKRLEETPNSTQGEPYGKKTVRKDS